MASNADAINEAYAAFARGDVPGLLDLVDDGVEWVSPATLPHGELRSGGSGAYGAAHAFTVTNGKITKFREYVDLDAPLAG